MTARARFHEMLQSAGHEPALAEACLLLCRIAGLDIDVAEQLHLLDTIAQRMPATFEELMRQLFQGPAALRGNPDDYYGIANSMLSEVLRTGLGIPITLSVAAMEIGRRAGVHVEGIALPGHFLVRGGADGAVFADPFGGGRILDRDGVRRLLAQVTNGRTEWDDAFLRPAAPRDILFRMLNNIKVACTRDVAAAIHLPWVLELLSWFPQGRRFDPRVADRSVSRFN